MDFGHEYRLEKLAQFSESKAWEKLGQLKIYHGPGKVKI